MPPYRKIDPFKHLEIQIESMIVGHQLIVDLLKTPKLAYLINSLNDPAVRSAALADPLKAAREAGLNLPAKGVFIQIREFSHSWEVEIQIEHGASVLVMGLNSRTGFFTR